MCEEHLCSAATATSQASPELYSFDSTSRHIALQLSSHIILYTTPPRLMPESSTQHKAIHRFPRSTPLIHKRVRFARDLVECYHRPLYSTELDMLNRYEDHIWKQPGCLRTLQLPNGYDKICPYCRYLVAEIRTMIGVHRARPIERRQSPSAPPTYIDIPDFFRASRIALECAGRRYATMHGDWSRSWLQEDEARQSDRCESVVEYYKVARTEYRGKSWACYSETSYKRKGKHIRSPHSRHVI